MSKVKDTVLLEDAINEARKLNKISEAIDILYGYELIDKFEKKSLDNRLKNKTWQH